MKGIIADCPYSSPKDISIKVCHDKKLSAELVYPFIRFGAKLYGRFNLEETSPVEAVKQAKIPILLIHGDADTFVPCEMSKEIYHACASPIKLELFSGAGHAVSYIADTNKYAKITSEFVKNVW